MNDQSAGKAGAHGALLFALGLAVIGLGAFLAGAFNSPRLFAIVTGGALFIVSLISAIRLSNAMESRAKATEATTR